MPKLTWDHFSRVQTCFPWPNASDHNTNDLQSAKITSFSHGLDLKILEWIHTFEIKFHMNHDHTSFPINRVVICLNFQDSIAKKSLPHWNSKVPKNQSPSFSIQVLLLPILCPKSFIGIIWSCLKHFYGLNPPATLLPVPPLLTSSFDLDKVITSKITLQASYHSLCVVSLIESPHLPLIYLLIWSFNLTLKN